ncbi:MAG: hypothetical protein ACXWXA_08435 [Candidatus Limnocylindrales bacterium]
MTGEHDEPAAGEDPRIQPEIEIGRVVDVDALALLPADELEAPNPAGSRRPGEGRTGGRS